MSHITDWSFQVNVNDLRWILKELGDDLTEEDIDDMIADVDTDGSGWVDYEGKCHTRRWRCQWYRQTTHRQIIMPCKVVTAHFFSRRPIPVNTKHLYNICTIVDQRRRCWADVVQMLYKYCVFAGIVFCKYQNAVSTHFTNSFLALQRRIGVLPFD